MAEPSTIGANAIATDVNRSIPNQATNGLFTVWNQRQSQARIWALGAATLVLGLAYAPNFRDLYSIWNADPNYSHGYLIIPIALFILWRRLSDIPAKPSPTTVPAPWWGWVFLSAVLALRAIAYEQNSQWVETATLLPVIACLTWTFGSWPLLRRAWPAILFLVFLFPLPPGVNDLIALPLQRIAASGSCFLLQLSGLWAIQEGNVIQPHDAPWRDAARRGPRLQWIEDADDHGRHNHGDDHPHPPADLEADHPACQYRAHRHAQQHHPDRGHRVVLLQDHGTRGEAVGTRHVRSG